MDRLIFYPDIFMRKKWIIEITRFSFGFNEQWYLKHVAIAHICIKSDISYFFKAEKESRLFCHWYTIWRLQCNNEHYNYFCCYNQRYNQFPFARHLASDILLVWKLHWKFIAKSVNLISHEMFICERTFSSV